MYYQPELDLKPEEILLYLRKSRTDDPTLSVAEILTRHETILDEYAERVWGQKIPEEQKMREIGSGETIESRPALLNILKMIESPKSFQVACTVMTQIIAAVASSQYGGQSVDIRHLGKYLRKTYDKIYKKRFLGYVEKGYSKEEADAAIAEIDAKIKKFYSYKKR